MVNIENGSHSHLPHTTSSGTHTIIPLYLVGTGGKWVCGRTPTQEVYMVHHIICNMSSVV